MSVNQGVESLIKKKKLRYPLPFVKLLPIFVTLLGLSIGVSSVLYALEGKWKTSVSCVIIAALVDGVDGRIARLLNATSVFGAELDSLCDFASFGICSAFILYLWLAPAGDTKLVSWGMVLIFVTCIVIRLARFNTAIASGKSNKYFFTGVPAPAGAILGLLPIILDLQISESVFNGLYIKNYPVLVNIYVMIIGFLMASRVPTISFKNININPEYVWVCLIGVTSTMIALLTYPWYAIPVLALIYLFTIPLSAIISKRMG